MRTSTNNMRAYERLLEYVRLDTQSAEDAERVPSTQGQRVLAQRLAQEMESLGLRRTYLDENGYVYGFIPASAGREHEETVGFLAHIDTAPDFSGREVKPEVVESYDGKDLPLGKSGKTLEVEKFPELKGMKGQTLIVTDGTTLLGADDKAGIAEIMTACERMLREDVPHCAVAVCFTPDEEIGHGAALLDRERFGADFAYTMDGDAENEINYETFNAAAARFDIEGLSVHPGSAKNLMVNACLLAMEAAEMLPKDETPAETEGYEGFYHLLTMSGSVEHAELDYIVRDHDAAKFEQRLERLQEIERALCEKYGEGAARLTIKRQYRNMAEVLEDRIEIVHRAERAIRKCGLQPQTRPVRGGTDGAMLSFRGLPCPNLGTGGHAFHGPYEHITAEAMDRMVDIILNIAEDHNRG